MRLFQQQHAIEPALKSITRTTTPQLVVLKTALHLVAGALALRDMSLKLHCSCGGKVYPNPERHFPTAQVRSTRVTRRSRLQVDALGFDFGDGERDSRIASPPKPSPKAFSAFTLRANSLLIYQHVFKGAVGEALLGLLAASQKYQASNKDIIAAYAKFYQLLILSGYDCWSDYLLDQILLGRDNPFARAVAQGQVQQNAPILQAVAYDLDTLQGLAVSLTTLAEYIGEIAPTAGSYWVSAASATSVKLSSSKQLPTAGAPAQSAVVVPSKISSSNSGSAAVGGVAAAVGSAGGSSRAKEFVGRPATVEELAQWRDGLAGHDPWSAALPLLQQYYYRHGFGITSRNSTLRWSKGGFEEASLGGLVQPLAAESSDPSAFLSLPRAAGLPQVVMSALQEPHTLLADNTLRHCAGLPAQHAVVCGPSGTGKSWLLWEGTLLTGREAGLRLVEVPASEVNNILDIARGCARYPRVRFILVADHLELPLRGTAAADISSALSGSGAAGWPSNTLLYVGASASSVVSRSDPLVARCPLVVPVQGLQQDDEYLGAVTELLSAAGEALSEADKAAAIEYGNRHGSSVRSAAAFVQAILQ